MQRCRKYTEYREYIICHVVCRTDVWAMYCSIIKFFCSKIGLFCGEIELFCGEIGLFCSKIGLFCGEVGLFCGEIGLFGNKMGLFCRGIKLFCGEIDLFCSKIGLFCEEIGLFCGEMGPFCRERGNTQRIHRTYHIAYVIHVCRNYVWLTQNSVAELEEIQECRKYTICHVLCMYVGIIYGSCTTI